jgi:hypothetical protein
MKINKVEFITLLIALLLGSYLRLIGVFTKSFAFTYDVGRDLLALASIVDVHKLILIGATTGIPGVFYGPWWYYLLSPFYFIFRGDPSGIALVMSVIGIISIVLAYVFGKKIGDSFLGLSLLLLFASSQVLVSLSAQIWNPNIAPLFVILTLFTLFKIFKLKDKVSLKYYLLLGLLLSLNIDIEILWGMLFTAGTLLSLVLVLKKKINVKGILLLFLGALIVALPRIIFELRHSFIMTKSFFNFLFTKNPEDPSSIPVLFLNRVDVFFNQFTYSLSSENVLLGIIILFFVVFTIIVNYKKSPELIKNFILYCTTVISVFFIATVFFKHAIWPHYLVGLPVLFILLFSLSLYILKKRINNNYLFYFVISILFLINLNLPGFVKSIREPVFTGDASVYRNQVEVIDYVYSQNKNKDFKYVVYTPPLYDYTYQYLFKWYGKQKYNYVPKEQANIAYFIIEPDTESQDRVVQWLKTREMDGKIIKVKKFNSGIIVQTRIH